MRGLARIEGGGGRVRPGARGFPSLGGGGLARRSASNPTPLEVAGTQMFSGEGVSAPFLSRISRTVERPTQNWHDPGESDCLIKTKHCDGRKSVLTQCDFCPVL